VVIAVLFPAPVCSRRGVGIGKNMSGTMMEIILAAMSGNVLKMRGLLEDEKLDANWSDQVLSFREMSGSTNPIFGRPDFGLVWLNSTPQGVFSWSPNCCITSA
jgi:hypothetical protein